MAKKENKRKVTILERTMFYCGVIGAILTVAGAAPIFPWRYAKVDTNVGNRFVMERYYFLTGLTNHMGRSEGWLAMKKKLQRKAEEFGRPSPLLALVGAAGSMAGAGGAATGCSMWMVCKEHVSQRFSGFSTVAYTALGCLFLSLLSVAFTVAGAIYLGFEQDKLQKDMNPKEGKKKKKKHDDDRCMDEAQKVLFLYSVSFICNLGCVAGFMGATTSMLKELKLTAYYPYAGCHVGPLIYGASTVCLGINVLCQCFRMRKAAKAGKLAEEQKLREEMMAEQMGGGGGGWGGKGGGEQWGAQQWGQQPQQQQWG